MPASRRRFGGARARTSERRAASSGSRRRWQARVSAEVSAARTVSFATLGCRLNQVDTQQIQTLLEARGFRTVDFDEPADVVVVNTCTVTARAELSDRQTIRRAARVSPRATLVVTGCWAQTSPGEVAGLAGVDLVVRSEEHTSELQSRPHLVCRLLLEKKKKHIRHIFRLKKKKKYISKRQ